MRDHGPAARLMLVGAVLAAGIGAPAAAQDDLATKYRQYCLQAWNDPATLFRYNGRNVTCGEAYRALTPDVVVTPYGRTTEEGGAFALHNRRPVDGPPAPGSCTETRVVQRDGRWVVGCLGAPAGR